MTKTRALLDLRIPAVKYFVLQGSSCLWLYNRPSQVNSVTLFIFAVSQPCGSEVQIDWTQGVKAEMQPRMRLAFVSTEAGKDCF